MIEEEADEEVRDAGLIAAAQRVEHYEIAGYGCAIAYAQTLGLKQDVQVLKQTIAEEGATDKALTKVALSVVNLKAAKKESAPAKKGKKK